MEVGIQNLLFYDNLLMESVMFDSILIVYLVVFSVDVMIVVVVDVVVELGYMSDIVGMLIFVVFGFGYDMNFIGLWM